ncbi:7327_t:CDS:2 [Acaulospora morrowiae]|uniref:Lysosomal dipeptide transporter MFSD1 n=1 Tax=Acaulospora morrowiae TaxID=94023 RepID=A0A9N8VUB5_9GLOM|nr:7327_t:CDS:2 [Acaulospora morrowiae]
MASSSEPLLSSTKRNNNNVEYTPLTDRSSSSVEISEDQRPDLIHEYGSDNEINKDAFGGEDGERPLKYKIVALLCVLSLSGINYSKKLIIDSHNYVLIAVGSHYAAHTLGALKTEIKRELGITNAQYGIIQSSVSLVNTILPILGGVFIDTFGTVAGSILATSLIATGNILVASSTLLVSFKVMVVGRIMYGIGSGTIVTIQTAILSHWFRGKGLAIAVGSQIAVARLSSFLANLTVIPIRRITGFYGWAFWFAAFLCLISFTINIIYVFIMRTINEKLCEQEIMKLKQKRSFNSRNLLFLPAIYWILTLLEFVLGCSWTSFLHIHTELVKFRWKVSDEVAAYYSSVAQFLPIFVSPFLGYLLDRFGGRSYALIASTVFLGLSMYFLGFTLMFSPIIGMICFSVSLSLGPVSLLSSIPIILSLNYVGTGLGIIKSVSNIGATLYDIFVGILQDKDYSEYTLVMRLYLFTSLIAMMVSVWLLITSRRWYDGVLDMKEDERRNYFEEKRQSEECRQTFVQQRKPSKMNWLYIICFVGILVLSWVLFFIFVIDGMKE